MTVPADAHPDVESLIEYFNERLTDSQASAIERHIFDCDNCADLSHRLYAVEELWKGWTADAHAQVHLRLTLLRALADAERQPANAQWSARLAEWREAWVGTAEGVVRTVVQAAAGAARSTAEGVAALARPGASWSFSPAPGFGGVWGEDDDDEEVVVATAITPDAPRAWVEVRGRSGSEVVVRVDQLPPGTTAPLVLLVAVGQGREIEVQVAELKRQAGSPAYTARFSEVPPGEYLVAFEPLAPPS